MNAIEIQFQKRMIPVLISNITFCSQNNYNKVTNNTQSGSYGLSHVIAYEQSSGDMVFSEEEKLNKQNSLWKFSLRWLKVTITIDYTAISMRRMSDITRVTYLNRQWWRTVVYKQKRDTNEHGPHQ